jgi:hypothetical protein
MLQATDALNQESLAANCANFANGAVEAAGRID